MNEHTNNGSFVVSEFNGWVIDTGLNKSKNL